MCGIVGYIGSRNAEDVLIDGLMRLEYRGYDSAGVAIINDNGNLEVTKEAGKLANLINELKNKPLEGHVGIGHTRWATHGKPSAENAHPHLSPNKKITIVHNGIIENYQQLKEQYLNGHVFSSETDTEVVAHLIERFYDGDLFEAVKSTLNEISGAYALVAMTADEPDRIVVARKESPLVIGLGENENFVASDVPALLSYTRKCIYLESGQMADLHKDDVKIYDFDGKPLKKEIHHIEWDEQSAEKGGYDHFMIKEINEQPETFRRVMSGRIGEQSISFEEFSMSEEQINNWQQIYIVACGTAYHSGLVGKTVLEKTLKIPVYVEVASEFRYRDPMLNSKTLVILISQSGETADTMAALREAKAKGATTLALTNAVGSAISREADMVLYLWAGPEISVASTKAYTSMLIALYLLGLYMGDTVGRFDLSANQELLVALKKLPEQAAYLLTDEKVKQIMRLADMVKDSEHLFYIGRGLDWAAAQEGALKLKEISYIHAEAYAAGELKHGTLALITEDTPVIAIALQQNTFDKTMSNVQEVIARDANVIALVNENVEHLNKDIEAMITVPECPDFLVPILGAIPLQLLAYFTARARKCNIDKPRNLAKSVTVE